MSQQHQTTHHLCQQIGHLWDSATVVKDYRRCTREQCHAAQRLVRGRWHDVAVRTRSQARQQAVQPTLFAPDRAFPDKHEERRAERALLDLLRH